MSDWKYSLYSNKELKIIHFDYDFKDDYNIIICRQDSDKRRFNMFPSPLEFKKFESSVMDHEKCFYEVILGKRPRKPYFDIDVSLKDHPDVTTGKMNDLIYLLNENIKELLSEYKPKIMVFESHIETKLSYHIVVDNVVLQTNEDSRLFSEKVLPVDMKEFADTKVYNTVQQLRIINSTKWGKTNKKTLNYQLSDGFYIPKDIKYNKFRKEMFILYSSLVTFTAECSPFKMKHKKAIKPMRKGNATEFDVDKAMEILNKKYENFKLKQARELNGNILVELVSSCPYHCNIHKRTHENENAYITIKGMMKNVWFDCRRIENYEKKLSPEFIGFLFSPKKKEKTSFINSIGFSVESEENENLMKC